MKNIEYNNDVKSIDKRKENEYYIGDIVQVKLPHFITVKNGMIAGYNHITKKWIIKWDNIKSGIKYEEVSEEYIVNLKSSSILINVNIPKNYKELEKYINNRK